MPRRYVHVPEPPKKRITPMRNLPSEVEALFDIPRKPVGFETTNPEPPVETMVREPAAKPPAVVRSGGPQRKDAAPSTSPRARVPRPEPPEWIVRAREIDLLAVAHQVGVEIAEDESERKYLRPCPRCGDATGAQVIWNRGYRTSMWRCPSCGVQSGVLDLAALTLMGAPLGALDETGHAAMLEFFEEMIESTAH